ncbi:hypothetical protein AB1Y20_021126 [Prymnesium parvum]|uniref:JmjC domain-containing protein n=1 Tax=Prymnesium parvum TaxID=97485 RepID=A0AB34JIS9_PRYPA
MPSVEAVTSTAEAQAAAGETSTAEAQAAASETSTAEAQAAAAVTSTAEAQAAAGETSTAEAQAAAAVTSTADAQAAAAVTSTADAQAAAEAQQVPQLPLLPHLPLDVSALHPTVRRALRDGSAALGTLHAASPPSAALVAHARQAVDAAREATFPFLEGEGPYAAAHAAAYAAASLWWAELALHAPHDARGRGEALRACDLAILRGGADVWAPIARPVLEFASGPETAEARGGGGAAAAAETDGARRAALRRQLAVCSCATEIVRVDARGVAVEAFRERYMRAEPPLPVVLTHALDEWPAMGARRWSVEYLRDVAGTRLVPVETCAEADVRQGYLSDSWERRVMSLADYIDTYVSPPEGHNQDGERGYLAQYQLFDQIPSLRRDVEIPRRAPLTPSQSRWRTAHTRDRGRRYCEAIGPEDEQAPPTCEQRRHDSPLISAWFGPRGSVSPLHYDTYHNLLAQVVGFKYIRIYDAQHTARLYPRSGPQCNSSFVDVDAVCAEEHPLFDGTPFHQCVLGPGDLLYIPRHAWHYVRALDTSFSVSFWWGARVGLRTQADGSIQTFY